MIATAVPSVLFYVCFQLAGVWLAFAAALGWCYGMLGWRVATGRRCTALLWITAVGLTAKTVLSLATGNTFVYFVQPAVTNTVIAVLFLVSLLGARPLVGRVAGDFFPMNDDVASRPRVQRLFRHLTLMWGLLCLGQAVLTVWLLQTASLGTFVAARAGVTMTFAVAGAAVTVVLAARIARIEQLLARRLPLGALPD